MLMHSRALALALLCFTPAPVFASPLAQVSPDAGPDQSVQYPAPVQLSGVLNNRSILSWWTADADDRRHRRRFVQLFLG